MVLKLTNSLTKVSYNLENLADLGIDALNYALDINLPDGIDNGEYQYELSDDTDMVVATGILQIGNYTPNVKPYSAQTHSGYTQYEG